MQRKEERKVTESILSQKRNPIQSLLITITSKRDRFELTSTSQQGKHGYKLQQIKARKIAKNISC
nr:hypothetical protein [Candidatus Baldrarchaeota archaeon]